MRLSPEYTANCFVSSTGFQLSTKVLLADKRVLRADGMIFLSS